MQSIKKEVFVVISEIIEKLCLEKSKLNSTGAESNFPETVNKDDTFLLCNEIPQGGELAIFHDVNVKTNEACADFDIFYPKSLLQSNFKLKEYHSHFSEYDLQGIIIGKELNAIASIDDCLRKQEHYLKFFNALREEFNNKYDIHHNLKKPEGFGREDVFVQTISETTDSEVQCDLLPTDISTLVLAENIEKPKMKLRNRCYSYMNYEKTHWHVQSLELPQTEPEPPDLGQNQSNKILKSASQIRIGLSKRFKSRSAQKL